MWRRCFAVLSLLFLAPLIAEYLLGSLPMSMIGIVPVMAAMYGAGAILIRDIVRRTGHGWPSIVLLAIAYGLIEEGLIDQSLFNPNYLHLRLLDFGWMPMLGTGLPWLVFVVSIHVVWSISTPIALTETLFKSERDKPWLGKGWVGGLLIAFITLLFLGGSSMVAYFTNKSLPFMASPAQLGTTAAVVVALIVAALVWPKARPAAIGAAPAPHPLVLFAASFITGSLFALVEHVAAQKLHWSWQACFASLLGLEAVFIVFMIAFTRGRAWTNVQRYALMVGSLLVYVWLGFVTDVDLHGKADLPGHAIIAIAFVLLAVFAGFVAMKPAKTVAIET